MKQLYTIGYEGQTLEVFLAKLADSAIHTLVDVRELPLSRKRGFSKRALDAALAARGIEYVHVPALGCPKPIRDRYRSDGDWARYTRAFDAYLSRQGDAVEALAKLSRTTTACLMCFEADFTRCHRSIVANAVTATGGPTVVHLELGQGGRD